MKPHIHAGVVTGLATFAMVIVAGSAWRILAYKMAEKNPESSMAKAMLLAY